MKKIISLILALSLALSMFSFAFAENQEESKAVNVIEIPPENETSAPQYVLVVDNMVYAMLNPLYMKNGRTMVDATALSELIGVTAEASDDFISFTDGENTVSLSLAADGAVFNDGSVILDAYASKSEGTVYVPLRFVSECFGCTVGFTPIFSPENEFEGAYISVDTNKPSNVDFTVVLPENLSETGKAIIDISRTITGVKPEITYINDEDYPSFVEASLLSGSKIMFLKNNIEAKTEGHNLEDLMLALDEAQWFTLSDSADDDIKELVLGENGKLLAYPVFVGDEILLFSISSSVENQAEAVYLIDGMEELVSSLKNAE